ncbi:MAG: alpha/beta fold hydrolase [Bacteroidota bacterium]
MEVAHVVLCPGMFCDPAMMWLSARDGGHTFDYFGHQHTRLSVADEARVVADGLSNMDQPVGMIGHSFGAPVAYRAAQLAPERVAWIALVCPAPIGELPFVPRLPAGHIIDPVRFVNTVIQNWGWFFNTCGANNTPFAVAETFAIASAGAHNIPIQVFSGDRDQLFGDEVADQIGRLCDCEVEHYRDFGHMLPLEDTTGRVLSDIFAWGAESSSVVH